MTLIIIKPRSYTVDGGLPNRDPAYSSDDMLQAYVRAVSELEADPVKKEAFRIRGELATAHTGEPHVCNSCPHYRPKLGHRNVFVAQGHQPVHQRRDIESNDKCVLRQRAGATGRKPSIPAPIIAA